MIVITSLVTHPRCVYPGDRFNLTITDALGSEVVIREEITVGKTIDFIASFRFALEDGTCPGFHLSGVFACRSELPIELQNAKQLHELTPEQREHFVASVGVKVYPNKATPEAEKHRCIEHGLPIRSTATLWHRLCVWRHFFR